MSACCLCSNLVSPSSNEEWNRPLFQSGNFVTLPSLGSLVEGWLMIVPREHFLCMGALPSELTSELQVLKRQLGTLLQREYGQVCIFEHGPSRANHSVGCSVDHAHLHLVPIAFDLADAARPYMPTDASWRTATLDNCRAAYQNGEDYLYVEQSIGQGRIAVHPNFGSQVFRKAIAAAIGKSERFNWREYPEHEVITRTIRNLGGTPMGAVTI